VSSVAGRMMRGSAWITGARVAINLIGFVSTLVLARILTPADFGLVALGTTILVIVTAVTDMSLAQALIHHQNPEDDHFHTAWTLNACRGLVLAALMAAAAHPLAALYTEPRLEGLIYALAFSVLVGGLTNPRIILLSKQLVFWQDFLLSVSERLVAVVVSIGVALYFRSYWALVAGAVAGQFAAVIISYAIVPFRPKMVWNRARELWSFSIWLTLGQAMNTINWRFDQLLIGHYLGRSILGAYAVGDNLAQIPTREAIAPLTHTLFPAFSRIADDKARLAAGYERAQGLVTAIALPVGVGFGLLAEPMVLAMMGEKWRAAIPIIQALSAVFALQTLGSLVQPLGMATGATRNLFQRDLLLFVLRLPVIIAAMLLWGLTGLIYARVATGLTAAFINMTLVRRLTGLTLTVQLLANLRSLTAVAVMAAGVIAIGMQFNHLGAGLLDLLVELGVRAVAGAALYVATSLALWHVAGRPGGPEKEILTLISRAVLKIKTLRASQ